MEKAFMEKQMASKHAGDIISDPGTGNIGGAGDVIHPFEWIKAGGTGPYAGGTDG